MITKQDKKEYEWFEEKISYSNFVCIHGFLIPNPFSMVVTSDTKWNQIDRDFFFNFILLTLVVYNRKMVVLKEKYAK